MTTAPRRRPAVKKAGPSAAAKSDAPVRAPAAGAKPVAPVSATKPPLASPAPVAAKADKVDRPKKLKLTRDSFTMPKDEYEGLDQLKRKSVALGRPAKKSELLRAGVKALLAMSDSALLAALAAVPAIKTGRPAKS
jgi:hypothetical protein